MTAAGSILLAVERPSDRGRIGAALAIGGWGSAVHAVDSLRAALTALVARPYDLVLTELRLSDGGPREVVTRLRELRPLVPIVTLAGEGDEGGSLVALRHGACEVLDRECLEPCRLRRALRHALERGEFERRRRPAPERSQAPLGPVVIDLIRALRETVCRLHGGPEGPVRLTEPSARLRANVLADAQPLHAALERFVRAAESLAPGLPVTLHVERRRLAAPEARARGLDPGGYVLTRAEPRVAGLELWLPGAGNLVRL